MNKLNKKEREEKKMKYYLSLVFYNYSGGSDNNISAGGEDRASDYLKSVEFDNYELEFDNYEEARKKYKELLNDERIIRDGREDDYYAVGFYLFNEEENIEGELIYLDEEQ